MSPQAFALRPVRLSDLPTLKRWRSLPEIQRHLRHPHTSWWGHLRWWWSIKNHQHPTRRVWAVTTSHGKLIGVTGLYYKMAGGAEVSVLVMALGVEQFATEREVVSTLLTQEAKAWGLRELWAEVLGTAPLQRHTVFPGPAVFADTYSTLYRWSIA